MLKITSAIPTDKGEKENVIVDFFEVHLNKDKKAHIVVNYKDENGEPVKCFLDNSVVADVPQFDLAPVFAIVKTALEAQGLQVEDL